MDEMPESHVHSNVPNTRAIILRPSAPANQSEVSFYRWTQGEIQKIYQTLCRRTLPEIAIKIIDNAEYWQVHKAFCWGKRQSQDRNVACPRYLTGSSIQSLCSDEFDGSTQNPLRRVIVRTLSRSRAPHNVHDTEVGVHDSHTWFEVVLQRFYEEENIWKDIVRKKLWNNVRIDGRLIFHVGSLESGEEIVDNAMKGDRIAIRACAAPGWLCEIVKIDVWTFTLVLWSGLV